MTEKVSFYRVGNVFHGAFRAEGMQTAPKPVPYRMPSTQEFMHSLALRFEAVIEKDGDPQAAMEEIAEVAERRGLIDSNALPRRESPTAFVMDLWMENPLTLDLLSLGREQQDLNPLRVQELADVIDLIPQA